MCGRFFLETPAQVLQQMFNFLPPAPSWDRERSDRARYNIAPTQPVLTIKRVGGKRLGLWTQWGLQQMSSRGKARLLINARVESVFSKPSFRNLMKGHRAIVLADGYFEWKREARRKLPFAIRGSEVMAMAALVRPSAANEACSLLTQASDDRLKGLHERMPLLVPHALIDGWLDPGLTDRDALDELLDAFETPELQISPVSERVNSVANDDRDCLFPGHAEDHPRAQALLNHAQLGFNFDSSHD